MSDGPFDFPALLRPFLPAGDAALAVAVSGGPDSMALCHALSQCANRPVHAVTVDHGLRPEAAEEAAEVGRRVAVWPHVRPVVLTRNLQKDSLSPWGEGRGEGDIESEDQYVLSPPHPNPLPEGRGFTSRVMETARHDRYRLLAGYCAEHGIHDLFTAHHQDDQAETFLFRLAKGSGLDGLGGMRPLHDYNETLRIIRPFLDVPKSALVAYCEERGIAFVRDPSNENENYARARLRKSQQVLAAEGLTPKRLAVTAKRLARARDALDFYAGEILAQAKKEKNSDRIVLNFSAVENAPEEIRLRVLAGLMDRIAEKQDYGPRMERLEDLAGRLFNDPRFKRASLGGCLVGIDRKKGLICVEKEQKDTN